MCEIYTQQALSILITLESSQLSVLIIGVISFQGLGLEGSCEPLVKDSLDKGFPGPKYSGNLFARSQMLTDLP